MTPRERPRPFVGRHKKQPSWFTGTITNFRNDLAYRGFLDCSRAEFDLVDLENDMLIWMIAFGKGGQEPSQILYSRGRIGMLRAFANLLQPALYDDFTPIARFLVGYGQAALDDSKEARQIAADYKDYLTKMGVIYASEYGRAAMLKKFHEPTIVVGRANGALDYIIEQIQIEARIKNPQPEEKVVKRPKLPGNAGDNASVATLIECASSGEFNDSLAAIDLLEKKGSKAREAIPALVALFETPADLGSPESRRQDAAASALRAIGPPDASVLPVLKNILMNSGVNARCMALRVMGAMGPEGDVVISDITPLLSHRNGYVSGAAHQALETIATPAAIDALIAGLASSEPVFVNRAAMSLGYVGKKAKKAIPSLVKAINANESCEATSTLLKIGDPDALPFLFEVLKDSNPRRVNHAIFAISRLGKGSAEALAALDQLNSHPKEMVRTRAAEARRALIVGQ